MYVGLSIRYHIAVSILLRIEEPQEKRQWMRLYREISVECLCGFSGMKPPGSRQLHACLRRAKTSIEMQVQGGDRVARASGSNPAYPKETRATYRGSPCFFVFVCLFLGFLNFGSFKTPSQE